MKASSATSAKATAHPRPTGRSSDKRQPTPTSADGFALAGPSSPPDPRFNAYRKDLADIALAGSVIASHYAEPVERSVKSAGLLYDGPGEQFEVVGEVLAGERFELLDDSRGWAWGYLGTGRRVGYLPSKRLA